MDHDMTVEARLLRGEDEALFAEAARDPVLQTELEQSFLYPPGCLDPLWGYRTTLFVDQVLLPGSEAPGGVRIHLHACEACRAELRAFRAAEERSAEERAAAEPAGTGPPADPPWPARDREPPQAAGEAFRREGRGTPGADPGRPFARSLPPAQWGIFGLRELHEGLRVERLPWGGGSALP